jgi:hypothetical protein
MGDDDGVDDVVVVDDDGDGRWSMADRRRYHRYEVLFGISMWELIKESQ